MPAPERPIAERVDERKVLNDLERGSGTSLAQLFSGKFEEDRVKSLHTIEQLYKQDVAAHRNGKSDLEFDTNDFWHNQISVSDNNSGKTIYYDQLDLKGGVHNERSLTVDAGGKQVQAPDRTYAMTADRQAIDPKVVDQVTHDLENGNPDSLSTALSGKMQEERVRFLQFVQTKNADDLKTQKSSIELDIDVEGFKHHTNELNVMRNAPGGIFTSNFWNNPASVYFDSLDMNTDKRDIRVQKDSRS